MLKNGFFITESFNAKPYFDNNIVNLTGAQSFVQDTVFVPGRYNVDIQAGSCYCTTSSYTVGCPALIQREIFIDVPFMVRAYCGSKAVASTAGINPYKGIFKTDSITSDSTNIPSVNHIFGNSGSAASAPLSSGEVFAYQFSSGNCLGDGAVSGVQAIGAGSCLHIMPVSGVFGTDYLFAFHCVSGVIRNDRGTSGGVGSAYGGAGSGAAYIRSSAYSRASSKNGGSTPYGQGGAGVTRTSSIGLTIGNNGSGIGYGYGGGVNPDGGGAWFDGNQWHDSRSTAQPNTDGHIILTYLDYK